MSKKSLFISRTPYRVSFFGGGSDYPEWYEHNEGRVLSMAIDKYCYITCRYLPGFFEKKFRVVWSHIETVDTIGEILHPCVREGLKFLEFDGERGIEIHHQGDLPARTGIGSSSSFSVGLIHTLSALKGTPLDTRTLAEKAVYLERTVLKERGGVQDQYAAAYGGLNAISFRKEDVTVSPVPIHEDFLDTFCSNLLLVYTGSSRFSSEVSQDTAKNLEKKRDFLRLMVEQAVYGEKLLIDGNFDEFGSLLKEAWKLKKELNQAVANSSIDEIYEKGIRAGALGGKLIGGGRAGFVLFYVPTLMQESFKKSFEGLILVHFGVDHEGSTLIVESPQKNLENRQNPHDARDLLMRGLVKEPVSFL